LNAIRASAISAASRSRWRCFQQSYVIAVVIGQNRWPKASLSGLGGGDLAINVTVSGSAVYQCSNNGGNTAAGQNKVLVGPVTAPTTIPGSEIKNGNVSFTTNPAVLSAPATVTGAEAGCPNPNWTGVNPTLKVTNISMTIAQGGATLFTCTASNQQGLSGTVSLSC
jgi:hypothetical protein